MKPVMKNMLIVVMIIVLCSVLGLIFIWQPIYEEQLNRQSIYEITQLDPVLTANIDIMEIEKGKNFSAYCVFDLNKIEKKRMDTYIAFDEEWTSTIKTPLPNLSFYPTIPEEMKGFDGYFKFEDLRINTNFDFWDYRLIGYDNKSEKLYVYEFHM